MKYKILKCFRSIGKIWSTVAIREIKILEMENESQFVKYTTLENNHLYGILQQVRCLCGMHACMQGDN